MLRDILRDKITSYLMEKDIQGVSIDKNNFKVEFLAQGEYNINYTLESQGNKYVFRVNTGSQIEVDNQIRYEYNAIKTLEVSGVTPRVFYVDDTKEYFEYGILIMEFLYGRPLEYDKDMGKAAGIFSKIHSLDVDNIDTSNFITEERIFSARVSEATRLLKDYLVSPIVDKKLKKFFYDFLEWADKNKDKERYFIENKWHVINNTEVNSHNFIIGEEKSYLIDWEKPVISDPCQDLTQFLAPTTTLWKANYLLSKEEKDSFYNKYIEGLEGRDQNIKERVQMYTPYLYLRALSWCAYAWLEYQDPNKDIKNMDTFRKIEEYLDVDFITKTINYPKLI